MYNFLVMYEESGDCMGLTSLEEGGRKVDVEEDEELLWGKAVMSGRLLGILLGASFCLGQFVLLGAARRSRLVRYGGLVIVLMA